MISRSLIACGILVFMAGCKSVGPVYEPPCPEVPQEWKNQPQQCIPIEVDCWWEIFKDEKLNELEAYAMENNYNLQVSLARIEEARAMAGVAKADLYPQFNITPQYTNTGQLFKIFLPNVANTNNPCNPTATANPFGQIPTVFRIHQLEYFLPITMNYEVDLWGAIRNQYRSLRLSAEAQAAAYATTLLTISTDLASAYYQLRSFDSLIILTRNSLQVSQMQINSQRGRYRRGLTNRQDLIEAELNFATTKANLEGYIQQRAVAENAIAALLGVPASEFSIPQEPLKGAPPCVPAGLPSELLLRRPDIFQAELQMAAQHALINVAYASYFPSLSLTGTIGYFSPTFEHFLRWISRYWSYGATGNQMLFDGWRTYWNVDLEIARFSEAEASYQQTVVTAFQEVENALITIQQQAKQYEHLHEAARIAREDKEFALRRYSKGLTDVLGSYEKELSHLIAEQNEAVSLEGRYLAAIQLVKALGGGWGPVCD